MVADHSDQGTAQAHDAHVSTSAWLEEIRAYWAELCRRHETSPGPMTTGGTRLTRSSFRPQEMRGWHAPGPWSGRTAPAVGPLPSREESRSAQ